MATSYVSTAIFSGAELNAHCRYPPHLIRQYTYLGRQLLSPIALPDCFTHVSYATLCFFFCSPTTQVFSVGVCMYRMLRPDPVYIDNGTGLEGKGGLSTALFCRSSGRLFHCRVFPRNGFCCSMISSHKRFAQCTTDNCSRVCQCSGARSVSSSSHGPILKYCRYDL